MIVTRSTYPAESGITVTKSRTIENGYGFDVFRDRFSGGEVARCGTGKVHDYCGRGLCGECLTHECLCDGHPNECGDCPDPQCRFALGKVRGNNNDQAQLRQRPRK
jgi:hypothetical protein